MKQAGAGWRRIPFVKLLSVLTAGILIEYYFQLPMIIWAIVLGFSFLLLGTIFLLPFFRRFQFSFIAGSSTFILFICMGGLLVKKREIRNERNWIGNFQESGIITAVIEEPATEKARSYKFIASLKNLNTGTATIPVKGRILVYIKKKKTDHAGNIPAYGTQIVFNNQLSDITGFGNPGGFDYGRYCMLKGISHQVFLDSNDYVKLNQKKTNPLRSFIFLVRGKIVDIIRTYIKGEKERGLAEALLIGYKNDLDRSLVKAYSDTGVVHIIAISGLHVGLIYWLLNMVFNPFRKFKLRWLVAGLMIAGLWLFSFLAGAQPSILRAALMFSCIIIEKEVSGRNSTYNTIALSAFILLCIDPFWLFDAGFQLSYAAVISIIAFMKPVYSLVYIKNKWLDHIWKMNAVTIAAQVLTLPLCLFYFQQFPNYFLLTNFIAVPLSSIILFAEIILLAISSIPFIAAFTGNVINWLIFFMNECIELVAKFPYATWESLNISVAQTFLLVVFCGGLCLGITEKSKILLRLAAMALPAFLIIRGNSFYLAYRQEATVVYNVPGRSAIDLVRGRKVDFLGDSDLYMASPERELYLDPARTYFRISEINGEHGSYSKKILAFAGKKIWILDHEPKISKLSRGVKVDLLILSRNPRVFIKDLAARISIGQVIIDGSVPGWKSRYWKKDCDSLGIPWHDVSLQGAFVMSTR